LVTGGALGSGLPTGWSASHNVFVGRGDLLVARLATELREEIVHVMLETLEGRDKLIDRVLLVRELHALFEVFAFIRVPERNFNVVLSDPKHLSSDALDALLADKSRSKSLQVMPDGARAGLLAGVNLGSNTT
jgi:hypothetical protein